MIMKVTLYLQRKIAFNIISVIGLFERVSNKIHCSILLRPHFSQQISQNIITSGVVPEAISEMSINFIEEFYRDRLLYFKNLLLFYDFESLHRIIFNCP